MTAGATRAERDEHCSPGLPVPARLWKGRAMTIPPPEPVEPQLWMTAENIFYIKGRGTVVTGQLEGSGLLARGDELVCDGLHWPVAGIERVREVLGTAGPGMHVGVLLRNGPPAEVLRGKKLAFVPNAKRIKAAARAQQSVAGKPRRRRA
jgi:translation elongation factor EF-Tu-like GTPase